MNVTTVTKTKNPFPGLRPFREDEEHLFFGRENQVDAMVDKLSRTHFLAVVGTSGSGKSSLVNCGLRPGLHGGLMSGAGTDWRVAQFRPGSDPIRAMAHALAQDGVLFSDFQSSGLPLSEVMDTTVRMSKLGLVDMYRQAHLPANTNLLVVVDQFEELFRFQHKKGKVQESIAQEAIEFVNLLLEAAEQTKYPIYIVLTMRSDFLGDCSQFRGLVEAINEGQYLVPRMTREERRAAIAGPVAVGGAEISPVLLTRLVNDVGDNPDQLSILQHALNRTWAQWETLGGVGAIDLPQYEAIGTMAHALDKHAEKAYAELKTERQQQVCKKVFQALTDKASDPRGTRRPTMFVELCALADAPPAEVKEVIEVFRKPSRSFLMPPAGETIEHETVIDISHESLMRVWIRLDNWANEEADSAFKFKRIAEAAEHHAKGNASLWQDPELQLALKWRDRVQPNEKWAARYHPDFETAMSFLNDSLGERHKRFRSRLLGITAMFLGMLTIVTAILLNLQYKNRIHSKLSRKNDAIANFNKGELEAERGNFEKAKYLLSKAEEIQSNLTREYKRDDDIAFELSHTLTAIGLIDKGNKSSVDALSNFVDALLIRIRVAESHSNGQLGDVNIHYEDRLANAWLHLGQIAMLMEKEGLDLADLLFKGESGAKISNYLSKESDKESQNNLFLAEEFLNRSLSIRRSVNIPVSIENNMGLGEVFYALGNLAFQHDDFDVEGVAVQQYLHAIEQFSKFDNSDDREFQKAKYKTAMCQMMVGRLEVSQHQQLVNAYTELEQLVREYTEDDNFRKEFINATEIWRIQTNSRIKAAKETLEALLVQEGADDGSSLNELVKAYNYWRTLSAPTNAAESEPAQNLRDEYRKRRMEIARNYELFAANARTSEERTKYLKAKRRVLKEIDAQEVSQASEFRAKVLEKIKIEYPSEPVPHLPTLSANENITLAKELLAEVEKKIERLVGEGR